MSARSSRWASRRASTADPLMRVSDAERTEVADRLSRHYSDGRLDQAEFNERLDRAMKAKTQSDLSGLFTDLPSVDEPGPPEKAVRQRDQRPRSGRSLHRVLGLILIVVVAVVVGHAVTFPLLSLFGFFGHTLLVPVPWLVIALAVFLWWRAVHRRRP